MVIAVQSLIAAAALGATGAGAQDAADDPAPRCVHVRGVNGYAVIDDRHLLLRGGADRHYLITTRRRCSGLRTGASVGLSFADTARVCPPFNEYVIPDDGWRCAIEDVVEVEDEDDARVRIAARSQAGGPDR